MKRLILILVALIALIPYPVLAIADPDSAPEIGAVYVYEFDDGSVGILIDYTVEYAALPTETIDDSYLVSFIDIDGTTQLSTVAPYPFDSKGYGRGIAWIKFTAAEVTTYGLTSANQALYSIWLMGNPTVASGWTGDPPKIVANIDAWYNSTSGDVNVLFADRIISYGQILANAWGEAVDYLIEATTIGYRLTAVGESYFTGAIINLKTMAPAAFSVVDTNPTIENLDYTTVFGAVFTNDGGTAVGSPITLAEGANTVAITGAGTFTIVLEKGTTGTAATGTATVAGSPVSLVEGTTTITVNAGVPGNITVTVALTDTTTAAEDSVIGTGFDLTTAAAAFGMTRWMFSGIIWFILSVVLCAGVYAKSSKSYSPQNESKIVLAVFDVWIIAGTLLGLLKPVVAIGLFLVFGVIIGYVVFFRSSSY